MDSNRKNQISFIVKYIAALIALADLAFLFLIKSSPLYKIIGLIVFLILAFIATRLEKIVKKLSGNNINNDKVRHILSFLPEQFKVIDNISVHHQQQKINHLIIGETGVYCLLDLDWQGEVKSGGIEWTSENKTHKNPVTIVMDQVKEVKEKIKSGFDKVVLVKPLIIFTNPNIKLKSMSYSVPLIKIKGLTKYLNDNLTGKRVLEQEEVNKIAEILKT